jgi:aminoglycoside phosphotransferase (APT) family kinase protein
MALLNRLDEKAARHALTVWLANRLPNADDLKIDELAVPQASGMSMTTVLFKASFAQDGEHRQLDLVARVAPEQPGLFPDPDLAKEFEVISAVAAHSDVAVPTPRWIERDASVLGAEFVVLDRAYGRCPADDPPFTAAGWVLDLHPGERARMFANGIDQLARIHALDWRALQLGFLDGEQPGTERELESLRNFYEWAAAGTPSPTIDAAFEWMRTHTPSDDELVLNWGDPRVGNMLFDEDHSVRAVLDWEMVTVASPSMDLAWWLFLQRHHTEGIGIPLPDGIPDRAQTIALYEKRAGRAVKHIDFYEALAALRSSIIMVRIGSMSIAAGALPADHPLPHANPSSSLLAMLLDLPAPHGATAEFLGNRT